MNFIKTIIILSLLSASLTLGNVTITSATGGTNLLRSTATNGHAPDTTILGDIVITETLVADIKQSQTNATLILTAPTNWQFDATAGSISATAGDDITAISMTVTASAITVTISTATGNVGKDAIDEITISGIGVQAIDGNLFAPDSILRSSANAGNAVIDGITADVTNFGTLSMDEFSSMPVELIAFTAESHGSKVKLNWSTATETDNYGFEVQRSVVSGEWEVVGFIDGHGNSYSPKEYEFIDDLSSLPESQLNGELEYRLKQIDTDGKFEFYRLTATVQLNTITDIYDELSPADFELFQNYPNPFNPSTRIQFSLKEHANVLLTVYNLLGEEINILVDEYLGSGTHDVEFNANNLPSGIYYYQLQVHSQESGIKYSDIKKMMMLK